MKAEELKLVVKEKYSEIANQSRSACGCGTNCNDVNYSVLSEDYSKLSGYNPDADLGLGCGIPTEFANIQPGDTVIDLGSGAGNDCFVARSLTGDSGLVIGIDMTEAMIEKARINASKLGYTNVEFRLGDIENMPVENNTADIIISNCVLNLVPDKEKAFSEIFRILKPGGHLSVSDIVLQGKLPESIQKAAEMYAGCVSGAILKKSYLDIMIHAGLKNVTVQREIAVPIPDETLLKYLNTEQLAEFLASGVGIFSITVYAEK
jgi:arsenite methyltransferase